MCGWMDYRFSIDFILNIFISFVLLGILIIYQSRRLKKKQVSFYLMVALAFALVSQLFYFGYLIIIQSNLDSSRYFEISSYLFLLVVFFFVYLHFEAISNIKPSFWRYTITLTYTTICISFGSLIFFNIISDYNLYYLILYWIYSGYGVFILLYPLKVSINSYLLTKEKATVLEMLSICLILLSNIVYIFEYPLNLYKINPFTNFFLTISDLSIVLFLIGLIILMSNYLINPDYLYRLPFPVYEIVIINKAGNIAYDQRLSSVKALELYSERGFRMIGVLSVISKIIKETLGTENQLKSIDSGNYKIFFSQIPNESGLVAILSSGLNYFLQKSLDNFAQFIPMDLIENINSAKALDEDAINKLDTLFLKHFPYLIIRKDKMDMS